MNTDGECAHWFEAAIQREGADNVAAMLSEASLASTAVVRHEMEPSETDARWLRATFELARTNWLNGDQPFAAILVGPDGDAMDEGVNTRRIDVTGHAEISVVRTTTLSRDVLEGCVLYVNAEPCVMCAGALGWSGIGTLVYDASQRRMARLPGASAPRFAGFQVDLTVESLLRLNPPIVIRGPLLEDEALAVLAEEFRS